MDRLDHRIRRRRQEAVDIMRAGDGLGLRAAIAFVPRPNAGEGGERPIIIEGEPHDIFFLRGGIWLRRVFRC